MNHVIGIMAMIFGFVSMAIQNYGATYICFGFAFVLWCVLAISEYKHKTPNKKVGVINDDNDR